MRALDRNQIAKRISQEVEDGFCVLIAGRLLNIISYPIHTVYVEKP